MTGAGEWGSPRDEVRGDGGRLKRALEAIIEVMASFSVWGGKLIREC